MLTTLTRNIKVYKKVFSFSKIFNFIKSVEFDNIRDLGRISLSMSDYDHKLILTESG